MTTIVIVKNMSMEVIEEKRFESKKKANGYIANNLMDILYDQTAEDAVWKTTRGNYIPASIITVVVNA